MATSGLVLQRRQFSEFGSPSWLGCNGRPPGDDSIQIFLAMGNSIVPMRILTSDTISSVKMRIQYLKRGLYVKQQKLVHDGRELSRDQSRVSDYGIRSSDVIHLVLRVSDLLEVVVKSWGGREYVLKIERDPEALRQISENLDEQSLILRGQRVDDQRLINDLVLEDNAVVHVVASKASSKFRARHLGGETELFIEDHDLKRFTKRKAEGSSGVTSWWNNDTQLPESVLEMISDVNSGLALGFSPVLSIAGTGGTYCMVDRANKPVAIFKPMDEEPMAENNPRGLPLSISGEGLKRGTRAGEGALREVAAYILDHPRLGPRSRKGNKNERGFAGVPPTLMIRCSHPSAFAEPEKLGSLQKFVSASSNCEDMGPAKFSAEQVHRIAILDLRLANTDRNGSNILVCESPHSLELVPIDHGYCLPHKFEDCTFEWLWWPQAKAPFSKECLEYIEQLDAEEDLKLLEEEGWRIEAEPARVLRVATMLLNRGAAAGLSAFDIGWMMCRERLNDKSEVERMVEEAEACVLPHSSEELFMETMRQVIDFRLARKSGVM